MQGITRIGPRVDGEQILVRGIHEPLGTRQGGGPGMAVLVRQRHHHERQRSEKRPMLLRHVVPNNCASFEFNTIAHAGELLDRLLAGVKGRRCRCHDSTSIMDARIEKTWLIPVIGASRYILVVTKYNHVRLIRSIKGMS